MSKADVMAGRAFVSLYLKNDMAKPLQAARKELASFGSGLLGIGTAAVGAGAAVVGGLTAMVAGFSNAGDALDKMSLRTGMSTTALAELGFAAEQSGATIEDIENATKRMQKNLGGIGPESIKTTESLQAMGLSIHAIQQMSPDEQFQTIAESISDIENPSERAAAAMAVFGESGRMLLPMVHDIRSLRQEAKDLGIAPSPGAIKAAAEINDAINRVRRVIGVAAFEIGAALAPLAKDILDVFLVGAKAVKKFVAENGSLIISAAKVAIGVAAAGTAIAVIGSAFIGAGMAISGFLTVFSAISATAGVVSAVLGAILSPVGLVVVALAGGVYAWTRFTESGQSAVSGLFGFITSTFNGIATTVNKTFGGIIDAIKGGDLELAGQIAMTGLRLVLSSTCRATRSLQVTGQGEP